MAILFKDGNVRKVSVGGIRVLPYLKYLRASKNRHGLHSPFAYTLLDAGINRQRGIPLLKRLQNYFGPDRVIVAEDYHEWVVMNGIQYMRDDNILYIKGIHKSNAAEAAWKAAVDNPNATLSIDLWEGGILSFSKDFKQKQHFVIRWKK